MNTILEVIKTNKKAIIKKALIVGGTIAGLAVVTQVVKKTKGASEDEDFEKFEEETTESSNE
jgi:hypothetical protein